MLDSHEDVLDGGSHYQAPTICDYGGLVEITRSCFGTGGEDGGSKANGNPFVNSAPFFGDPQDFCQ